MKEISYFKNVKFEIKGEREAEAAEFLKEALTGVSKRKSAYIEAEVEAILEEVKNGKILLNDLNHKLNPKRSLADHCPRLIFYIELTEKAETLHFLSG